VHFAGNLVRAIAAGLAIAASAIPTAALAGADDHTLPVGATVQRSSFDGTLTADDRKRLAELGIYRLTAAAIVIHKIPRHDESGLGDYFDTLLQSVERFTRSGVCGAIAPTGKGTGLCSGHAPGPFGRAPLRMTFEVTLAHEPKAFHLLFTNTRSLEAKPVLAWTPIVYPGRLKVLIDLVLEPDGWLVYTRMGVEMKKYASAARRIVDAMFGLDAWLVRELEARPPHSQRCEPASSETRSPTPTAVTTNLARSSPGTKRKANVGWSSGEAARVPSSYLQNIFEEGGPIRRQSSGNSGWFKPREPASLDRSFGRTHRERPYSGPLIPPPSSGGRTVYRSAVSPLGTTSPR
jgi:hypothetical protein